jgi:hypothetical protein
MCRRLKMRITLDAALMLVSLALCLLTLFNRDWIEKLTGLDPRRRERCTRRADRNMLRVRSDRVRRTGPAGGPPDSLRARTAEVTTVSTDTGH